MGHSASCCSTTSTSVRPLLEVIPESYQNQEVVEDPKKSILPKKLLKDACNSPIISISPRNRGGAEIVKHQKTKFLSSLKSNSPSIIKRNSQMSISDGMSFRDQRPMRKVMSTAQGDSLEEKRLESPVVVKALPSTVKVAASIPVLPVGAGSGQFCSLAPLGATPSQRSITNKDQRLPVEEPQKVPIFGNNRTGSPLRKTSSSKNVLAVIPQKIIFDSLKECSSRNSEKGMTLMSTLARGDEPNSMRRESRSSTVDLDQRKSSQNRMRLGVSTIMSNPAPQLLLSLNRISATPHLPRSNRVMDLLSSRKKIAQPDDGERITTQLVKGRDLFASSPDYKAAHRIISPSFTTREATANVAVGSVFRQQSQRGKTLVTPQFSGRRAFDCTTNLEVNKSDLSAADTSRASLAMPKNYSKIQNSRRRLLSGTLVETQRKASAFGVFAHADSQGGKSQHSPITKGVGHSQEKLIVPESEDEAEHSNEPQHA